MNKSNKTCLICKESCGTIKRGAISTNDFTVINKSLFNLLGDILDKQVSEEGIFSKVLCKSCYDNCIEYNSLKVKLHTIKTQLRTHFNTSKDITNVPKTSPVKKIVVPASKLQPVPPGYVLKGLSPSKVFPVTPTKTPIKSKPTISAKTLKTSTTSTVTSEAKTPTKNLSTPKTQTKEINQSLESTFLIDGVKVNVNLPKDFLATAKSDDDFQLDDLKKAVKDEMEKNEPMEIEEDLVGGNESSLQIEENDKEDGTDKEQYFDVSILPLEGEGEGSGAILGKLQILQDPEDDDNAEETIVMSDENGSLMRVISGQKLVYQNGQIQLVPDDGDDDDDDDTALGDGQDADSNDESQIELQVSGDEETANAIIAAAQEQGGAFIKVESGQMFRVKSVQSTKSLESTKTKDKGSKGRSQVDQSQSQPEPPRIKVDQSAVDQAVRVDESEIHMPDTQIVQFEGGQFHCLLCNNSDKLSPQSFSSPSSSAAMIHLKSHHDARAYICGVCNVVMRKRMDYTKHLELHNVQKPSTVKSYQCDQCGKRFSSRTLLRDHAHTHEGKRPYTCDICQKTFASKYTHQAHLKTHLDRPRPFKCTQCPKSFYTSQNLIQHVKTHTGVKDFVCKVCGKAFGTQHNLEVHGVVHSGNKPFVCGICGKAFARRAEVRDHIRIHTGERPFQCTHCGARFAQRSNLHSHTRATHFGDTRHHCEYCPKQFKRRRYDKQPYQCTRCSARFAQRSNLHSHTRATHFGDTRHHCEYCPKQFKRRRYDKQPYQCIRCGARFAQRSNLHSHTRATHLGDTRHHCEYCPKQFKRRRLLDYHIKASHTGERPLVCEICQTSFVYPEHYKKHARIHSGEKPYTCEVCGKKFNSRDNRNTHRFVHSEKKPYECLVCGAGYMRKQLLYQHMNASNHLAESIVVNQPRIQKMESLKAKQSGSESATEKDNEASEFVVTTSDCDKNKTANPAVAKQSIVSTEGGSEQTEETPLFTIIQNLDDVTKSEINLQGITADPLGQQVPNLVLTNDENGGIRLVQLHCIPSEDGENWTISQE